MRAGLTLGSLEFLFTLFLTVCMAGMAAEAVGFSVRARYFPLTMGVIGTLAGLLSLVLQVRRHFEHHRGASVIEPAAEAAAAEESDTPPMERVASSTALLLGFLIGVAIFGMQAAALIFVFGTQYFLAKVGFLKSLLATGICLAVLLLLGHVTSIRWPEALLPALFKGRF